MGPFYCQERVKIVQGPVFRGLFPEQTGILAMNVGFFIKTSTYF